MTWSLIARDSSGAFGVVVASKFFAVGALCPHARSSVGALATQALVNPLYAAPALDGLGLGQSPASIIERLTAADEGRDHRQLHLIGASGQAAGYTGSACIDWCGHRAGVGYSVAGNMLAGPQVIEATALAYEAHAQLPFAERLITALAAGEAAGGDKRGKQSAALVIYRDQDFAWLNLRVDDHADPLGELNRLYAVAKERYLHVAETMPTRDNPSGMIDRREIDERIAGLEAERLAAGRPSASFATPLKPAT